MMSLDDVAPKWTFNCNIDQVSIKFGDSVGDRIISPDIAKDIKQNFNKTFNCSRRDFPGSLAVSVMRSDLLTISSSEFVVHSKTDGQRYILYAYSSNNDVTHTDMFERSSTHTLVRISFKKSIFRGTALDGELVKVTKPDGTFEHQFQVFDCIGWCGKCATNLPYKERLEIAENLIKEHYRYETDDCFRIVVKKPFGANECIQQLLSENEPQPYPTDGVVIVDALGSYVWGRDVRLFKYKTIHTVDFRVKSQSETLDLCILENGCEIRYDSIVLTEKEKLDFGIASSQILDGCILECVWKNNRWCPYRKRTDKNIPNNTSTLERTVKNMTENITPVDIFTVLKKSEQNAKQQPK